MRGVARFVAFCFLGTLLGLISAQHAISGRIALMSEAKGPWTVWPRAGEVKIDPYTRAHHLSYGLVPSNRFETVEYEARIDDAGRALDEGCTYEVSGAMPKARWWSLSAFAEDDDTDTTDVRHGLVSQQMVYEPNRHFRIAVSRNLQPGNWLRPPASGQLVLVLRLYGPAAGVMRHPDTAELPSIARGGCL